MPDLPSPTLPSDAAGSEDFSRTLLEVALTGFILFRPVYDAAGATIIDLAYEYLNPAAQQLLRLPQQPTESFLTRFPNAGPAGIFAFYRDTFLSGQTQREAFDFQHDGLDGYFHLVARRQGALLVVSFLDTHDPLPAAQAQALRQSQAREINARRAAERERNLLQALLTQAPVAIGLFQGDDCVVSAANDRLCAMWGHAPAQVLGRPLLEGVPELRGQGFTELLQQVASTRVPFVGTEAPAQLRQPDGQLATHYFNFVYQPLYAPDGAVLGVVDIAVDVTEQVLARQQVQQLNEELELRVTARSAETRAALFEVEQQREQLRQQQRLLSQILGQVPAAIATLSGPEHRYSFFNDPYQAISAGRTVLGYTVGEVFPELVEQGIIHLLDQVYTTGQPFIGTEILLMLRDSAAGQAAPRYLDFTYQPLLDGKQQTQGILIFALDVTEKVLARKQADTLQAAMLAVVQRQAQQRQELFQIFEQTPVAIVLLREPDHRIDYFNPAFQELFPPEEWAGPLQGHTLSEVYPRIKLTGMVELLDKVYATGESQAVLDMPLAKLQPGSPRYLTFAYQAYREQGRIVGVAAFLYDVTDQVLARQQVQALNEQLAATNAELRDTNARLTRTNVDLDTFVYTASHDLKAPITNIEGLLVALGEQLPAAATADPLVAQLFALLQTSVDRFQQTLEHLAGIAQLQQYGEHPTELVDVAALVEAVRLDLAPLLLASQAAVFIDVSDGLCVRCAPNTLRSVVYNLLSNAVKYQAPDRLPVVHLRGHAAAGQLVLAVQDNGLGLSSAQQQHLFRMFQRLHAHVEGAGVGLYMVKRLVENAGGTISVQSEPGVGSTFTVQLPAA